MQVRVIAKTQISDSLKELLPQELHSAEGIIAYCARVSSDKQDNPNYKELITHCMQNGHWSILEQANLTLEIQTSRAISPQILRHHFHFQEFSQRYQVVKDDGIEVYNARRQDKVNRQNSFDDLPEDIKQEWERRQQENWERSYADYKWALEHNAAKECARVILPLGTKTRLFLNGTMRNWVHYCQVRCDPSTQKEHRDIAIECWKIIRKEFPTVAEAAEAIYTHLKNVN